MTLADEWIAKIVGQAPGAGVITLWNACKYNASTGKWVTGHGVSPTRQRSEAESLAARLNAAASKRQA